jgi:hypothetical protein
MNKLHTTGATPTSMQMDMQLENTNPINYGYKLLEASGEFPEATWNI